MISTNRILSPYTNDLVRLAASVKIVIDSEKLTIRFKEGCRAILEGYQKALKSGGCPFVLAEHEKNLDRLGVEAFEPPDGFWEKLDHLPVVRHGPPRDVKRVLRKTLPNPNLDYKVVRREAGLGSLGQQRFVAIASWEGGHIAREAKAMLPRHAFGWMVASEIASPTIRRLSSSLCDRTIHFRKLWERG